MSTCLKVICCLSTNISAKILEFQVKGAAMSPKTSQRYGYTFLGVLLKNRGNNADRLKFTS